MISQSVHKRPSFSFPLKSLLRKSQRTQYSLAKQTKLSTTYLNRVANGKAQPGWKVVCIIAQALGADLGDFAPGSEKCLPR